MEEGMGLPDASMAMVDADTDVDSGGGGWLRLCSYRRISVWKVDT
jgi:hypothetical protein